jgi:cytoskeletal protein CcmA (bactofilin family)
VSNVSRMGQPAPSGQSGKTTLIEDDTEFKGILSSKCPVVVKGAVEGEVVGPSLHVSPSGSVAGKVKVGELHSEGTLSGEFDAESVQLAGSVKSDTVIRARSLEVRLAPATGKMQVTFGQCELAVGDVPSKEDAVAVAAGKPIRSDGEAAREAAERAPTEADTSGPSRGKPRRDSSIVSP